MRLGEVYSSYRADKSLEIATKNSDALVVNKLAGNFPSKYFALKNQYFRLTLYGLYFNAFSKIIFSLKIATSHKKTQ